MLLPTATTAETHASAAHAHEVQPSAQGVAQSVHICLKQAWGIAADAQSSRLLWCALQMQGVCIDVGIAANVHHCV